MCISPVTSWPFCSGSSLFADDFIPFLLEYSGLTIRVPCQTFGYGQSNCGLLTDWLVMWCGDWIQRTSVWRVNRVCLLSSRRYTFRRNDTCASNHKPVSKRLFNTSLMDSLYQITRVLFSKQSH